MRYLLRKKLCYLAIFGIVLSVATMITVTSIFTGFHLRLTSAIRGYLSDLRITPIRGRLYGLDDWPSWVEQVRSVEHVEGVAPYIESFGLAQLPGTTQMSHVFIRGIHPELETTVSDLADYMKVGSLDGLDKTYPNPEDPNAGRLSACIVGAQFPGFSPDWALYNPETLDERPGRLILMTATAELERSLRMLAVNGLFESTYFDYDSQFAIMALDTATSLMQSGGAVTGLSVRLDDYDNAEAVREKLQKVLSPGARLRSIGTGKGVRTLALSGDGSRCAVLTESGRVIVYGADGAEVTSWESGLGDGAAVLTVNEEGDAVFVGARSGAGMMRDLDGGSEPVELGGAAPVTAAAISPDGWTVAVGYEDGSLRLWETDLPEEPIVLDGHSGAVSDIGFDAMGEKVLTGSADGSARLWLAESGRLLGNFGNPFAAPVESAAVSRDGERVAIGDAGGRIVLWSAEDGAVMSRWLAHESPVRALSFGGAPDELVSVGDSYMRCWMLHEDAGRYYPTIFHMSDVPDAPLVAADFGGSGTRMLAAGTGGAPELIYSGPPFGIRTWEEQQQTFLEAVAMERFLEVLIMSMILVVAEFFIFAILTTMVNERRRDIGILKAVGFTSGQVCLVFVIIGLAIGLAGGVLGVGAGILVTDNVNGIRFALKETIGFDPFPPDIYYFKDIPTHMGVMMPLLTAGGAVVCSLLFSIWPALRAARMDPVRTLHYE